MTSSARDPNEPGSRSGAGAGSIQDFITFDAARKASPLGAAAAVERGNYRVLVVDDNQVMQYAVARALRQEGYQTAVASTGAECLQRAASADAVVLDVHLPDMDGVEVCRLLRVDPATARVPVLHLTAESDNDAIRPASAAAGANAFVLAPSDPRELAEILDRLVLESSKQD